MQQPKWMEPFEERLGKARPHTVLTRVRRKWGTFGFGTAVASSPLRKHMPDLYRKQDGMDALCGIPLPNLYTGWPWNRRLNPDIEVDHIIPRPKDGSDSLDNLQLTKKTFNRRKGNRHGSELKQAMPTICRGEWPGYGRT